MNAMYSGNDSSHREQYEENEWVQRPGFMLEQVVVLDASPIDLCTEFPI
jgi:hypothetical protein